MRLKLRRILGSSRTPQWHTLYYVLAGLDIVAVIASLSLSHRMSLEYEGVVAVNQEWASRQKGLDILAGLVQETNAPGNDVFDTKAVKDEATKMAVSLAKFNVQLKVIQETLVSDKDPKTSSMSTRGQPDGQQEKFEQLLLTIETRMNSMTEEAKLIFSFFAQGNSSQAGTRMATMDRKYGDVLKSISELRGEMQRVQANIFEMQQAKGASLRKWEYLMALAILGMITGVTLYGRRMSKFVNESVVNKELQQAEIEKQRASLIESSKLSSLGVMAGGIAHELNNPLSIILGKASQTTRKLKAGAVDPSILIDTFEKIEKVAIRMSKIIIGLKMFSRNAEGDPFVPVQIKSMITDTLELCSARLSHHGVELRIEPKLEDLPDLHLTCRATQVSQVIINLLNNADDAVEGLAEKWISLEVLGPAMDGKEIQIKIRDSGRGIAKDVVQNLMQPFFTTKGVSKGTGLGLSISKRIAELHGGTLVYDGTGKNTLFVLTLPLAGPTANIKNQQQTQSEKVAA